MRPVRTDVFAGLLLLAGGGAAAWGSWQLPLGSVADPGPGFLPLALSLLLLLAGALVALGGRDSPALSGIRFPELRRGWGVPAAVAFAALALERLGYRLTVALVLFFLLAVIERRPVAVSLAIALVFSLGSFWVFLRLLQVPLPLGVLGF